VGFDRSLWQIVEEQGMDKMIELELKLRDGGSYYLCDTKFSVMSGRIRRQINAKEHVVEHYASVNGYAVKHTYDEVVEMIRRAKRAARGGK
jgi:hypothetical protein